MIQFKRGTTAEFWPLLKNHTFNPDCVYILDDVGAMFIGDCCVQWGSLFACCGPDEDEETYNFLIYDMQYDYSVTCVCRYLWGQKERAPLIVSVAGTFEQPPYFIGQRAIHKDLCYVATIDSFYGGGWQLI